MCNYIMIIQNFFFKKNRLYSSQSVLIVSKSSDKMVDIGEGMVNFGSLWKTPETITYQSPLILVSVKSCSHLLF